MNDILEKLNELQKNTEKLNPDFNDIKYNSKKEILGEYIEYNICINLLKKIDTIIFSMTPNIKKIIFIYENSKMRNFININNYITENIKKLMLINNIFSINNLPKTIFHLGFINNKIKIKFNKIHKNIKYLELKNSNQYITGYKNIKINTKINKILYNVHTYKCTIYGKNGSETICHNVLIDKKYNINYDREICIKMHKSKTFYLN